MSKGRACSLCGRQMKTNDGFVWHCVCGNVVNEYKKPPFPDESERDKRYG